MAEKGTFLLRWKSLHYDLYYGYNASSGLAKRDTELFSC
jgi:hypothetical protein